MGLFGKLKSILLEEDDTEEIPTFTQEDIQKETKQEEPKVEEVKEEKPIEVSNKSSFSNMRRELTNDSYEDDGILEDVPGGLKGLFQPKDEEPKQEEPSPVERPSHVEEAEENEAKSLFPSFDPAEFEEINSRLTRNEERQEDRRRSFMDEYTNQRRSEEREEERTSVREVSDDEYPKKRPFISSPTISPVYGILGKNYTVDEIVDKTDGLKREVVKPVVHKEIATPVVEEPAKPQPVTVETVRAKAFGNLEKLEEEALEETKKVEITNNTTVGDIYTDQVIINHSSPEVKNEIETEDESPNVPEAEVEVLPQNDVEDILAEEEKEKEEIKESSKSRTKKYNPENEDDEKEDKDLERTSTLQILDDIEKELNQIKPISKKYEEENKKEDSSDDELFNLIDSMYDEDGEDNDD